jgi:hypothetical protein
VERHEEGKERAWKAGKPELHTQPKVFLLPLSFAEELGLEIRPILSKSPFYTIRI